VDQTAQLNGDNSCLVHFPIPSQSELKTMQIRGIFFSAQFEVPALSTEIFANAVISACSLFFCFVFQKIFTVQAFLPFAWPH
jgi:hypothetical protein